VLWAIVIAVLVAMILVMVVAGEDPTADMRPGG
jgi:hypothetical protein